METVYPQEVWDQEHTRDRFEIADSKDQVRQWIERWTASPSNADPRCIEIGCFPGRYLAYLGSKGFQVSGIDLTPRVEPEMKKWLSDSGYRVGRIERGDFFAFTDPDGFDLVISNGFIEHFPDWRTCLKKHLSLVRPGGKILISAPNFTGWVPHFLHRHLDRENLARHYLPSMDPTAWGEVAKASGFEVLGTEFFGRFEFWNGPQPRPFWQKLTGRMIQFITPVIRIFLPMNRRWISPYCGMIARRKN